MTLGLADIMDAACSHAQASGWFEQVSGHEPKNAPGAGVSCALFTAQFFPVKRRSGMATTTVCVELTARLYLNFIMEPQDEIDPTIMAAADALCEAYSGDFTLGGLISNVDLLGADSQGLRGKAGYIDFDGRKFRSWDITVPLIVNDLWSQEA